MSKHDPLDTLRQMRSFAEEAAALSVGHTAGDLLSDLAYRRHAERISELIGEAANRLPEEIRAGHPGVPWREIIGLRNWLIHGYDGIDADILWDVLSLRAAELVPELGEIIVFWETGAGPGGSSAP